MRIGFSAFADTRREPRKKSGFPHPQRGSGFSWLVRELWRDAPACRCSPSAFRCPAPAINGTAAAHGSTQTGARAGVEGQGCDSCPAQKTDWGRAVGSAGGRLWWRLESYLARG